MSKIRLNGKVAGGNGHYPWPFIIDVIPLPARCSSRSCTDVLPHCNIHWLLVTTNSCGFFRSISRIYDKPIKFFTQFAVKWGIYYFQNCHAIYYAQDSMIVFISRNKDESSIGAVNVCNWLNKISSLKCCLEFKNYHLWIFKKSVTYRQTDLLKDKVIHRGAPLLKM